MLSTFILSNSELLTVDRRSFEATALGSPPTRTVIVGDRISSRKIVFLLSSLINDSYNELYDEQLKELTTLFRQQDENYDGKSELPLKPSSYTSNASHNHLAETSRRGSLHSIQPLASGTGWEIPKPVQISVAESPSYCTMSHVIRPSFSPSALSSSVSSNLGYHLPGLGESSSNTPRSRDSFSFSTLRKSISSATSLNSSLFSNIWPSKSRSSNSSRTSAGAYYDDIMFHGAEETHMAFQDNMLSGKYASSTSSSLSSSVGAGASGLTASSSAANTLSPNALSLSGTTSSFGLSSSLMNQSNKVTDRTATTLLPLRDFTFRRSGSTSSASSTVSSTNSSINGSRVSSSGSSTNGNGSVKSSSTPNNHGSMDTQAQDLSSSLSSNSLSFLSLLMDSLATPDTRSSSNHKTSSKACADPFGASCTSLEYRYVDIPEKSSTCIDISPIEYADMSGMFPPLLEPIVLPPVVGHVPEFHPDFALQACIPSPDLDEKITQAMLQDSYADMTHEPVARDSIIYGPKPSQLTPESLETSVKPHDFEASPNLTVTMAVTEPPSFQHLSSASSLSSLPSSLTSSSSSPLSALQTSESYGSDDEDTDDDSGHEIVSKTLVINLHSMEITEHMLVRDTPADQIIYRNTLFSKGKPSTPAVAESLNSVETRLGMLISPPQSAPQSSKVFSLSDLEKCYDSRFDLL